MLDKLASYSLEKITLTDFYNINGLISKGDMTNFITSILTGNNEEVINTLTKFDELGYDFSKLIEKLMQHVRDMMVNHYVLDEKDNYDTQELYRLIMCFNEIYNLLKEAANRRIIVEVKLLKFMNFKTSLENKEQIVVSNEIKSSTPKNVNLASSISQEIFQNKKNVSEEQKKMGNEEKMPSSKKYEINNQIKRQRINNTFALASKLLKSMVMENWQKLNDYLANPQYAEIAGILKDSSVGVASNTNLILITKYASMIDTFYLNLELVEELLKTILNNEYKVVLLEESEFQTEVGTFKEHMKDKNYYTYKEELEPLVNYLIPVEKGEDLCYGSLVQKAIDVFGKEYVEIE